LKINVNKVCSGIKISEAKFTEIELDSKKLEILLKIQFQVEIS